MGATAAANPASQAPGRPWLRPLLVYVLPPLVALALILVPLYSQFAVLPRLRTSPGFALIDQNGQPLTSEDVRSSIVVYSLATLDCRDGCAETLDALRQIQREVAASETDADAPPVQIVTVILDAPGDQAKDLAAFARAHDIDLSNWSLLSGSAVAVEALADALVPGGNARETALVLADHAGFVRAEYHGGVPDASEVVDDINRIIDEQTAGSFGGLVYGAAHKFNFTCASP